MDESSRRNTQVGQEKNVKPSTPSDYELVDSYQQLETFIAQAQTADAIAVDLEADSMFHYKEKVCLIQMAANGYTVVIDPLELDDLSALQPIFEDHRICKIFHGADYDVRSLYRDFDIVINNLFDTQLAGMYLGYAETSLEAMVANHFGVELDKKYQKKDWSQRPLPPEMVAYAASDVLFLIPLAEMLIKELKWTNRFNWVKEGCDYLSQVRPPDPPHTHFLKFRGAGRLTPRQLAVLEELLQFRDSIARHKDRPLFKVISNAALLKIAVEQPRDTKQLTQIHTLSSKQMDMYAQAVLQAVKKGQAVPSSQLPIFPRKRAPRLSPRIPRRVKLLKAWRDDVAARLNLDPSLLFNKALIREIAINKPTCIEELRQVPHIHNWQVDAFGDKILSLLEEMV